MPPSRFLLCIVTRDRHGYEFLLSVKGSPEQEVGKRVAGFPPVSKGSGTRVFPPYDGRYSGGAEVDAVAEGSPVLVPNLKGLEILLDLLSEQPASEVPYTDEIAVFTAATDAFAKANTNCTVAESLRRLEAVTKRATKEGLRFRGYVLRVVIDCPYSGKVDPVKVKEVTQVLLDMGCYP
ncbi:hypothetical protein K466DRAFT_604737 [Polyporus arcularius HHB13444]|uniref:Uncharacterized protein n=1 Tax=Polyporus arcularius HHB13444 TaxID=1314778 RepID=A0A5C3NX87_9APHY|nr:hypothetical protein K466DRAFT_604737 [Polyporus arcularius HHB13444]